MATTKQNDTILGTLPEDLEKRAREVWLAGLGVVAVAEEEGTKLYDRFVERGRRIDKDTVALFDSLVKKGIQFENAGRQRLNAAVEDVQTTQRKVTEDVTKNVARRVEGTVDEVAQRFGELLERFGVPTRDEVRTLTAKVEALAAKVDTLVVVLEKREQAVEVKADAARTTYQVVPREEGWAVEKEGASRATSLHETKVEAVESARALAKEQAPSAVVILKKDGTVQDTVTYDA